MSETTSRELSIALKEAGAKQESKKYLCIDDTTCVVCDSVCVVNGSAILVSTFDCHELLIGLPNGTALVKYEESKIVKEAYYLAEIHDLGTSFIDMYAVEALGKLKLWRLQNGHCERTSL